MVSMNVQKCVTFIINTALSVHFHQDYLDILTMLTSYGNELHVRTLY